MPRKAGTITREKGVELIADLIFKGKSRKEIVLKFTTEYKVSEGCVDKWIKQAKPKAELIGQEAEKIRASAMDEGIRQAMKEGLLSDIEIEIILCKIVAGGITVEEYVKGDVIIRGVTPPEQIAAARVLYLKRGSNALPKLPLDEDGKTPKVMSVTLNLG